MLFEIISQSCSALGLRFWDWDDGFAERFRVLAEVEHGHWHLRLQGSPETTGLGVDLSLNCDRRRSTRLVAPTS